ncbi:unnamed protein product [Ostreobium quekettii]|uniref:Uncharacterized protein n=1 Tax=Ostreobium quekettii TaxID=121088 RepID=A0A8S1INB5_9CHLO|nr:unnamed protein product [Ostreobium quekettii]
MFASASSRSCYITVLCCFGGNNCVACPGACCKNALLVNNASQSCSVFHTDQNEVVIVACSCISRAQLSPQLDNALLCCCHTAQVELGVRTEPELSQHSGGYQGTAICHSYLAALEESLPSTCNHQSHGIMITIDPSRRSPILQANSVAFSDVARPEMEQTEKRRKTESSDAEAKSLALLDAMEKRARMQVFPGCASDDDMMSLASFASHGSASKPSMGPNSSRPVAGDSVKIWDVFGDTEHVQRDIEQEFVFPAAAQLGLHAGQRIEDTAPGRHQSGSIDLVEDTVRVAPTISCASQSVGASNSAT